MNRIWSPNSVLGVLALSAIFGIVLAIIGMTADVPLARISSLMLIAPIVVTGVLLIVVVFPILIIANWKHLRSSGEEGNCNENELPEKKRRRDS